MKKRTNYKDRLLSNYYKGYDIKNPLFPRLIFRPRYKAFVEIEKRFYKDGRGFFSTNVTFSSNRGRFGYYVYSLHFFASNPEDLVITSLITVINKKCKDDNKFQKLLFCGIYYILKFAKKSKFKRAVLDIGRTRVSNDIHIFSGTNLMFIQSIPGKTPIIEDGKIIWEV